MKKNIFLLTICILFTNYLFSQTIDTLLVKELSKPVITCETVSLNSQRIITALSFDRKDSIRKVLNAWKYFCGENEPILRMSILLDISDKKDISEKFRRYYDKNTWETFADKYRYRFYNPDFRYDSYPYNDYVPNGGKYDEMTKKIAEIYLPYQSKNSLAYLFCEFIKGDFEQYNEDVHSNDFKENKITEGIYGKQFLQDYMYSIFTGIWIPQGHLSGTFNENLLLSVAVATPKFLKNNFLAEIKFSARTPFNKPTFVFTADDSVYTANNDGGFNLGVNFIYEKPFGKKNYLRFFSGISLDWLATGKKTFETQDEDDENASYYYITTFSVPFGVGIRRNIFYRKTAGFDIAYHYTPYNIDKKLITDLSGNYVTASIFFGF